MDPLSFTLAIWCVRLVELLLNCIHSIHLSSILVCLSISGWTQEISLRLSLISEHGFGKLVWLVYVFEVVGGKV